MAVTKTFFLKIKPPYAAEGSYEMTTVGMSVTSEEYPAFQEIDPLKLGIMLFTICVVGVYRDAVAMSLMPQKQAFERLNLLMTRTKKDLDENQWNLLLNHIGTVQQKVQKSGES